jgi:hypothetical protein
LKGHQFCEQHCDKKREAHNFDNRTQLQYNSTGTTRTVPTMKIDTRKITAARKAFPHSIQTRNKYIPQASYEKSKTNAGSNDNGREILYETVIVAVPVLASVRLQRTKRLLNKAELDKLTQKLDKFYVASTRRKAKHY